MIATIILLSFFGAITYLFFKDQATIERFRKNIHQGDTVKCHLGQNIFTATVEKIPGADRVVITDLDYNDYHIVSINSIYPL